MKRNITFKIERDAGAILKKSVDIPAHLKQLHILVEMPQELHFTAVLEVLDAKGQIRLQKLLGYGEQKLGIGSNPAYTSPGAVVGTMEAGEWVFSLRIDMGAVNERLKGRAAEFHITLTDEALPLTETIGAWSWMKDGEGLHLSPECYDWNHLYQAEARWYKGDFHTHTRLSDGKDTMADAMRKAVDMEMDFYVPTEHNLLHTGWCATNLCILPGIEITTADGHFNLFGITKLPDVLPGMLAQGQNRSAWYDVEEIIRESKKENWLISINHPFLTIWSWKYDMMPLTAIDCLEIINDPTYPDGPAANEKTLAFWDAMWEDGYKITGIGGSDAHNLISERYENAVEPSIAGDPGTWVYCRALNPAVLMESVRNGHTAVSRFITIKPEIVAKEVSRLPGDELEQTVLDNISYGLTITGTENYLDAAGMPQVYLIKNGQRVPVPAARCSAGVWHAEIRFSFIPDTWQWARMEVRGKDQMLLGFTNPIYAGTKVPQYETFGELAKACEGEAV